MVKRIDTSGRAVVRPEHMDDASDIVTMSVSDWNRIKNELESLRAKALISQPDISVCRENVNVGVSPKTGTSKE